MTPSSRQKTRKKIRQQRRDLSPLQQKLHAQQLAHLVCRQRLFLNAKRIACYLAEDGEIDPVHIIETAWRRKKKVYLPILAPTGQSLFFAPFEFNTPLKANRFGILEPDIPPHKWLRARQLNLILLPLVAFDKQCNRLGMGGGCYDRSLAFIRHRKQLHSPHLMGLAHELQKVAALPCAAWDVAVKFIATEKTLY
jgi:5-formyltetrahydrofolate cyclo-ligase